MMASDAREQKLTGLNQSIENITGEMAQLHRQIADLRKQKNNVLRIRRQVIRGEA